MYKNFNTMFQLLCVQCKKKFHQSLRCLQSWWDCLVNVSLCCVSGSCSAADIEFYCERAIKETIDWSHYCLISPAAVLSLPAEWVYSETGNNKRALLHLSSSHFPEYSSLRNFFQPASITFCLIPSLVFMRIPLFILSRERIHRITLIHPFLWTPPPHHHPILP